MHSAGAIYRRVFIYIAPAHHPISPRPPGRVICITTGRETQLSRHLSPRRRTPAAAPRLARSRDRRVGIGVWGSARGARPLHPLVPSSMYEGGCLRFRRLAEGRGRESTRTAGRGMGGATENKARAACRRHAPVRRVPARHTRCDRVLRRTVLDYAAVSQ